MFNVWEVEFFFFGSNFGGKRARISVRIGKEEKVLRDWTHPLLSLNYDDRGNCKNGLIYLGWSKKRKKTKAVTSSRDLYTPSFSYFYR
jgi:hypothetical protein